MAKSGRQYADDVRELREAGFDFPASRGYRLADASNWSVGLKSAVTKGANRLDADVVPSAAPDGGLSADEIDEIFEAGFGEPDQDDEFDDIDFFDPDSADDFFDEENDDYEEDT